MLPASLTLLRAESQHMKALPHCNPSCVEDSCLYDYSWTPIFFPVPTIKRSPVKVECIPKASWISHKSMSTSQIPQSLHARDQAGRRHHSAMLYINYGNLLRWERVAYFKVHIYKNHLRNILKIQIFGLVNCDLICKTEKIKYHLDFKERALYCCCEEKIQPIRICIKEETTRSSLLKSNHY